MWFSNPSPSVIPEMTKNRNNSVSHETSSATNSWSNSVTECLFYVGLQEKKKNFVQE